MNIEVSAAVALTNLSIQDAEEYYSLIECERKMLGKYLYWVDSVVDIESTRDYLNSRITSNIPGASWYKITCNEKAIGIFGIKSIDPKKSISEIGFWLSSKHHGKGIMSKLVAKISVYLKNNHNVSFMQIHCLEENRGLSSALMVSQIACISLRCIT